MGPIDAQLISTWSFGLRGHERAWPDLSAGGSALDAVEQVCRTAEADPEVDSVGRGGLPDALGQMSLDAAVMLSPDRCGAVAAVSDYLHVASIARRVMERSPHVLLVGSGADRFARDEGFQREETLLTAHAQAAWQQWQRARHDSAHNPDRPIDQGGGSLFGHDTISTVARDTHGLIAGACSTSGLPYKQPGRVGDCPIIGHGLYVHPDRGAALATGAGELVMAQCGAFLAVECMGAGAAPLDAAMEVLTRIAGENNLRPEHQVGLITMAPDGRWSSAALRPGYRTSITTCQRHEVVEPDAVLLDEPADQHHDQMR
jgi:isoaspartyl peptidase/L-asparaginase-like protein (Ntn-hydrolase superfamily)